MPGLKIMNLIVLPCRKKLFDFAYYYLAPPILPSPLFLRGQSMEHLHLTTTSSTNLLSPTLSPYFHKAKEVQLSPIRLISPPGAGLSLSSCASLGTNCSYLIPTYQCLVHSKCGRDFCLFNIHSHILTF